MAPLRELRRRSISRASKRWWKGPGKASLSRSNGGSIRTSLIVSFEPEASRAETLNTNYWLGHPIKKLSRDQSGQITQFELAGLIADRDPATGVWTLMGAGQVIDTPAEVDHVAVIARILGLQPPLPAPSWLQPQ